MFSAIISGIIIWFRDNLLIIQFISFLLSSVLLFLVIFFIIKVNLVGEQFEHYLGVVGGKDINKRRSLKAWKEIQKKLKTGDPDKIKSAIIEADAVLNEILKMAAYPGTNLEERLEKISPEQIANIEELRQAHKLKTRIFNEPDFVISANEAAVIIDIYKKAFQELNLME